LKESISSKDRIDQQKFPVKNAAHGYSLIGLILSGSFEAVPYTGLDAVFWHNESRRRKPDFSGWFERKNYTDQQAQVPIR
jgi:hypothetical protein